MGPLRKQTRAAAFVSTLSFVSNTGIGDPRAELAFEISDSETGRSFLQFFRDPIVPSPSVGEVDPQAFNDIFGKLAEERMKYSDRVGRAISFCIKGLRETHPLERFTSFGCWDSRLWDKPLKETLSAPDEKRNCSKCGHETKVNSSTGVRELMRKELPDGDDAFKRMRNLRVQALHSTEPLSPLLTTMGREADVLQELLCKTIFRFLDAPYSGKVVRAPIANIVPMWFGLEGVVNGLSAASDEPFGREYPQLVVTGGTVETIVNDDGSVTKRPTYNFDPANLPDGAQLSMTGTRTYGERGKIK